MVHIIAITNVLLDLPQPVHNNLVAMLSHALNGDLCPTPGSIVGSLCHCGAWSVHIVLVGIDALGLGFGLDFGLGFGLGCCLGLALGLANYMNHFGWHEQIGRASASTLATGHLYHYQNTSQVHQLHT